MTRIQISPTEIAQRTDALNAQVAQFTKLFSNLENEMAQLLHNVLFYKDHYEESRVAHAIYFTPDGFGGRQYIVNNAVVEWLAEHPLANLDFLREWNCINHRLGMLRGVRNLLAHGATRTVEIRDKWHTRFMPPTIHPKLVGDRIAKGGLPGVSAEELEKINTALSAATRCVMHFAIAIAENDYGDSTLQQRFAELGDYRSQLNSLYPDDQTPQVCKDPPQSSAE